MSNIQLTHGEFKHEVRKFPIYMILDNVEDIVNIGSIFRIADALGVSKIFICGIKDDILKNKKIKRISRNTINYVEYQFFDTTIECIKSIKKDNNKIVALEITSDSISLNSYCFEKDTNYYFVVGNESKGVSEEVLNSIDDAIHIDMYGNNSSMNLSVAAGIAINECLNRIK